MQIILTQNVDKLGRKGEVKNVKSGFYSNFLSPKGLAFTVTPKRLAWAKTLQDQMVKEKEQITKEASKFKETLEAITLTFEVKTSDKDTLYGSIGEKEIIKELEKQAKIKLDKKQIKMSEHIKTVGTHTITVNLADDFDAQVKVDVKALS